MRNRRILIIAAVVGLLVLVVVYALLANSAMATLKIDSVPDDLTLTLDGKQVPAVGILKVGEGSHELKAARPDFISQSITFTVKRGEDKTLGFYLIPANDAGKKWLEDHPDQISKSEGAAGQRFDENSQQMVEQNPIIQQLPVIDTTFRIDYGSSKKDPDKAGAIALYIQTIDQAGRDNALDWLRTYGYDPASFEIIYTTPE